MPAFAPVPLDERSAPPLAHTATEISRLTGYSKAFVYRLVDEGRLPAVRVGRSVRVLHSDLVAFLDAHRDGGPHAA